MQSTAPDDPHAPAAIGFAGIAAMIENRELYHDHHGVWRIRGHEGTYPRFTEVPIVRRALDAARSPALRCPTCGAAICASCQTHPATWCPDPRVEEVARA